MCLTAQNCVMRETFRVVLSHMAATSHLCKGASVTQEVVILFNFNLNEYRCVCLVAPYWIAWIRHVPGLDFAWLQTERGKEVLTCLESPLDGRQEMRGPRSCLLLRADLRGLRPLPATLTPLL